MDLFFYYATWLGSLLVLLPAGAALAALCWRMFEGADICLILGGLLGASLWAHLLKIVISRPRPVAVQDMLVAMPTDFSFPSGHTAQATSFFVALALVASRSLPTKTAVLVWLACGLVIVIVGYSRIYLKVHYISDVIAGAALGIVWVYMLNWFIHAVFTGGGHA